MTNPDLVYRPVTSWSRTEEQLGALGRTAAHVASEITNSVGVIMTTVSGRVCYLMPDVTDPQLPIAVLTERDQVADYYQAERQVLEVVDSCDLVELSSSWYVFHEGVATTLQVATGRRFSHTYVVLFPVADDGIVGEILWPRQSLADLYAGRDFDGAGERRSPSELLDLRRAHQAAHDAHLAHLQAGDVEAALQLWSVEARVAVRDGGSGVVTEGNGRSVVADRLAGLLSQVDEPQICVLSRVVGEWYVFADWVVRGTSRDGQLIELRMASIYPMTPQSHFAGELGYGCEAEVASRAVRQSSSVAGDTFP